jgi:hypothetical protein
VLHSESVLGILAFILAIPMAVVANALTPSVVQWWARTSESRRHKRVARLTKVLPYWTDAASNSERRLECLTSGLKWLAWSVGLLLFDPQRLMRIFRQSAYGRNSRSLEADPSFELRWILGLMILVQRDWSVVSADGPQRRDRWSW